jgi:hypothetical protein
MTLAWKLFLFTVYPGAVLRTNKFYQINLIFLAIPFLPDFIGNREHAKANVPLPIP